MRRLSRKERDGAITLNDSFGFRVWRGAPSIMPVAHQHTEIEINFLLRGWMRYFLAGKFVTVPSDRLVAMWAGTPHRLVAMDRDTECVWVTIPLAWFLAWGMKESFSQSLLAGDLMMERSAKLSEEDRRLHERWVGDFESPQPERQAIAMLEIEARLRRLALDQRRPRAPATPARDMEPVERIAAFVSAHYTEDIGIGDIARAAKLHPNYAMTIFKKNCGMTLREYVARLRVSHAQRLLLTSDAKILEVMLDSGFKSASRFYDTFAKTTGKSPRAYRALNRGQSA
jgi:AraC family transcriptional regulator, melibiose operon regulatory protein